MSLLALFLHMKITAKTVVCFGNKKLQYLCWAVLVVDWFIGRGFFEKGLRGEVPQYCWYDS